MKKPLESLFNKIHKKDMELLFGEGCFIKVNYINYSTNNKTFVLDCKLYTKDIESCIESYPHGLEFISEECWKYMGFSQNISIISSIDII
jgi:hypothetical protein